MKKKPIIGLCGAIGAGKSTVADLLGDMGCLVHSSDTANREILRRPEVAEQIRQWWGAELLTADGSVNRSALADRIFSDPAARKRLESLTHPLIGADRATKIAQASSDPAVKAVVLDSPLLFEAHLDRECDVVVYVQASHERRLARVTEKRGWDADELARRAAAQIPPAEKRKRSNFVIDNDFVTDSEGSRETLRTRVADVLDRILSQSGTTL